MSLITEEIKAKADELYYGDEMCQIKSRELLKEMDLPNGLLPMKDMEECGIVKETGFVWLRQKKSYTHKFKDIDRLVTYGTEVTAYVEKNKVKKLTGVKAKELLIWLPLCDIYVNQPPNGKITFKSTTGLSRTFPESAFQVEEEVKVVEEKENKEKEHKEKEHKEKENKEKEHKEKENKEKEVVKAAAAAAAIEVKEV